MKATSAPNTRYDQSNRLEWLRVLKDERFWCWCKLIRSPCLKLPRGGVTASLPYWEAWADWINTKITVNASQIAFWKNIVSVIVGGPKWPAMSAVCLNVPCDSKWFHYLRPYRSAYYVKRIVVVLVPLYRGCVGQHAIVYSMLHKNGIKTPFVLTLHRACRRNLTGLLH